MTIERFDGEYSFLSNFSLHPVWWDDWRWLTAEHAYQGAKTFDHDERTVILTRPTPGQAKRAGRKVTLRPDWEQVKLQIMYDVVLQKFKLNWKARQDLLATGVEGLVEGNHWGDTFWGQCNGVGENHLGRILMRVREELRA